MRECVISYILLETFTTDSYDMFNERVDQEFVVAVTFSYSLKREEETKMGIFN